MEPNDSPEPLTVSVTEAARLLGIGRGTAYECVRSGDLPSIKLGRRIVIPRRALDALLDTATTNTAA